MDKIKKYLRWLLLACLIAIGLFGFLVVDPLNLDQSVTVSRSVVDSKPNTIPDFSGLDSIELNDNIPSFVEEDYRLASGEYYSELDRLGRCRTAVAVLDHSMQPAEDRGQLGRIEPTGWNQAKYAGYVDSNPPYLYNRCHLIAYALTGQNANEKNLITGTRYMNATSMLPFEKKIMKYLDKSQNHVLYRVSPLFRGEELVARGVELEAYSIEDGGAGICFHVFVYNYQPGITIDYLTGKSWITEEES